MRFKIITVLVASCITFMVGCDSKSDVITEDIINELIDDNYSDRFTPLAISNLTQSKEYYGYRTISNYKYEVLTNDDYYTILITDNDELEFKCVFNLWYNSKDDIIENACVEYSVSYNELQTTVNDKLDYEPGFVPGSRNIVFEDEMTGTISSASNYNLDDIIPPVPDVTTTNKPREELIDGEIVTTTEVSLDPSITFIYE